MYAHCEGVFFRGLEQMATGKASVARGIYMLSAHKLLVIGKPLILTISLITMEQIMKNYLLPLALVSVVALQACNQKATETASEEAKALAAPAASAAPAGDALTTTEARLSYGIAYGFAHANIFQNSPSKVVR